MGFSNRVLSDDADAAEEWGSIGCERLIRQANHTPFEGWDFGVFRGRFVETEPSWELSKLLRTHMQRSSSMLDLASYDTALRAMHAIMEIGTPLKVNAHRFLIIARRT